MKVNIKDAAAGGIFILIGLWFVSGALNLQVGTAFRMGPGYFPLVLAGLMILLGGIIAVKAIGHQSEPIDFVPLRGFLLILLPPILFGIAVRPLGLVPSVAMVVLVTSFASRRMSVALALALTVGLTAFCWLVFSYGLGLPIPVFGSLLRF